MHEIIKSQVLPLVGKVKWEGFIPGSFGSINSLQTKLLKHIGTGNKEKLRMYLAICIQEWPIVESCPIDTGILKQAIEKLA